MNQRVNDRTNSKIEENEILWLMAHRRNSTSSFARAIITRINPRCEHVVRAKLT